MNDASITAQEARRTTITPADGSIHLPHKIVALQGAQRVAQANDLLESVHLAAKEIDHYFAIRNAYPELDLDVDSMLHRIRIMLT